VGMRRQVLMVIQISDSVAAHRHAPPKYIDFRI
jgi:hypothetical protein